MRVIDSNISARSSERGHRILAASRSAKQALLHREREGGFELQSTYADSRTLSESDSVGLVSLRLEPPIQN